MLREADARPGAPAAGRDPGRLCPARRSAPAARPRLDPARDVDHRGRDLLRGHGPELGARRHDQGADHRGRRPAGAEFLQNLRPFIWRKHLDFAAIQDIHSIKRQIHAVKGHREIAVGGHNIKLGRGGIREIEFFAQTQQLIWGGRNPDLRLRRTCAAIEHLVTFGRTGREVADDLIAAYRYLRHVEHRLQMIDDHQTQTLPDEGPELDRLALFCGHANTAEFSETLMHHLGQVEDHYADLFEEAPSLGDQGNLVFTGTEDDPATVATLVRMGFPDGSAVSALVRAGITAAIARPAARGRANC